MPVALTEMGRKSNARHCSLSLRAAQMTGSRALETDAGAESTVMAGACRPFAKLAAINPEPAVLVFGSARIRPG
jgi:hypothetical protein